MLLCQEIEILSPPAFSSFKDSLVCQVKASPKIEKIDFSIQGYGLHNGIVKHEKDIWICEWKSLSDGLYIIVIETTDTAGKKNVSEISTQVDNIPPIIDWNNPSQEYTNNKATPLYIQVLDDSKIADVCYFITSHEEKKSIVFQREEKIWKSEFIASQEGKYTLVAQAKDIAGNIGRSKSIEIIYDTTEPAVIISHPKQEYLPARLPVKIQASDQLSGIKQVELWLDEKQILLKQEKGDVWEAWIEVEKTGIYQLTPFILDKAGNQAKSDCIRLNIIKDPPVVFFHLPGPSWFSENATIIVETPNSLPTLKQLDLFLDQSLVFHTQNPIQKQEVFLDLSAFKEGIYSIKAQLTDYAENKGYSESASLIIDRSPPKIESKILPSSINIGLIKVFLAVEDRLSGLDGEAKPNLYMELHGEKYDFSLVSQKENKWEASLLITKKHKEGTAMVYIEGIQDKMGHRIQKTHLGSFSIRHSGNAWPLSPRDKPHPLLAAFPQDNTGQLTGMWIHARPGSEVFCMEEGKIVEIQDSLIEKPGYILLQRNSDSFVWGYHHLILGINPSTARPWACGDTVQEGQILGKVAKIQNHPDSFLYLELLLWKENQWEKKEISQAFLMPFPQGKRVSPDALLLSKNNSMPSSHRVWDFYIPQEFICLEISSLPYTITDFLMIGYIIFFIAIIAICYSIDTDNLKNFLGIFDKKFYNKKI